MPFGTEQVNIGKIINVVRYAPKEHRQYRYPGTLPTYELMFYEKGESTVTFMNKHFHMTPGSVLFLPKGVPDNEYSVSVKEDFSLYNIYFDTADCLPREPLFFSGENAVLKGIYEKIFRTWLGKRSGYYYKSMELAYQILELLHKSRSRYAPDNRLALLDGVEDYMAEHYCDIKFDYTALVNTTGLSYSYFKKLFIDKYGCPPVKYITRLKINRACELLQTGKFPITEVAKLCGFENVYYFSNVFKKQTGIAPRYYKG